MISINVNGKNYKIEAPPAVSLLWVLREHLQLNGTKYGCGIGECGACTVHIDGQAERACTVSIENVNGSQIVTIEGLPENHPIKRAWVLEQVPQCGYCQPGQMMQAASLLEDNQNPSEDDIIAAMDDILCRCGSYPRIKRAIKTAVELKRKEG
jgi:isoquinoline 1-oxidoreductase alpha subunit